MDVQEPRRFRVEVLDHLQVSGNPFLHVQSIRRYADDLFSKREA